MLHWLQVISAMIVAPGILSFPACVSQLWNWGEAGHLSVLICGVSLMLLGLLFDVSTALAAYVRPERVALLPREPGPEEAPGEGREVAVEAEEE